MCGNHVYHFECNCKVGGKDDKDNENSSDNNKYIACVHVCAFLMKIVLMTCEYIEDDTGCKL